MKEHAHLDMSTQGNVIGLNQLGRRLKNLVYLSAEHLYEWALLAMSDELRALLIKYHVDRSQLAMAIDEYLVDYETVPIAANDDRYDTSYLISNVPNQVSSGDSEVLAHIFQQEQKFASDVKRLANLLPEFPGDLLLNIGFSCCELKAELVYLQSKSKKVSSPE